MIKSRSDQPPALPAISSRMVALAGTFTCAMAMILPTAVLADPPTASQPESGSAVTGTGLEEIVVTATRRDEPLSKVPLSVEALPRDAMDAAHVITIDDVARLTPGLEITKGGQDNVGRSELISIRGISSSVGVPTTGVYLDDTALAVNSFPAIYDLDRVEVLRGPQGTLFGAGAEGGVIRFITPQPDLNKYSVYSRDEAAYTEHGDPTYEIGVAGGGPIIDGVLGFRVSASDRRDGGWINRIDANSGSVVEPNANWDERSQFREALTFVHDELKATLSLLNSHYHTNATDQFWESLSNVPERTFNSGRVLNQPGSDSFSLPTLNVRYSLPWADLISNTSYLDRKNDDTADYSTYVGSLLFHNPLVYGPGQYSGALLTDREHDFQQELRVVSTGAGRVSWVAGAYYEKSTDRVSQTNYDPYLAAALVSNFGITPEQAFGVPLIDGIYSFISHRQTTVEQKALYANANVEVVRNLKLTLGARVEKSSLTYSAATTGPVAGPGGTSVAGSQSQTPVSPKFGLSYQLTPDSMLYAYRAKGYRVGGVNSSLVSLCDTGLQELGISGSQSTYRPDTVWSNEIGIKSRALGGALQLDVSAFDILWKNIQQSIFLASCGDGFTANLGTAKSDGFDATINWQALPGLVLGGNLGYANARLTSTIQATPAIVYGRAGDKIGGAPVTIAVYAESDFPIPGERIAYVRLDNQFIGNGPTPDHTILGGDPAIPGSEHYDQLSLRTGIRMGSWDISLFANNLLNESPIIDRYHDVAGSPLFFDLSIRPRTFGVTSIYRY